MRGCGLKACRASRSSSKLSLMLTMVSYLKGIEFDIVSKVPRKKRAEGKEEHIYLIEKRWRDSPYKTIPISVYIVA